MGALAALVAILTWLAVREHAHAAELIATTTKLRETQDRDAAELTALRSRNVALQKERDTLIASAAATKSASRTATPAMPITSRPIDISEYMEADPEYPAFREKILQERVTARYGNLRSLNLPPEKFQKLQHLLADRMAAPWDAQAAGLKLGLPPGSPETSRAIGESMREIDGEIINLLGKTDYAALQTAQRQAQNLSYVQTNLGLKLTLAGQPFSGEQVSAVTDVLSQYQKNGAMTTSLPPEQEQALQAHVAQLLTPQQFEIFLQDRTTRQKEDELRARSLQAAKKSLGHDINSWSQRGP